MMVEHLTNVGTWEMNKLHPIVLPPAYQGRLTMMGTGWWSHWQTIRKDRNTPEDVFSLFSVGQNSGPCGCSQ